MQPEIKSTGEVSDFLAADLMQIRTKKPKAEAPVAEKPEAAKTRPSLRGNLTRTPKDDQISSIAVAVARDHGGFTSVAAEKLDMERMTIAIPAATGQDLAEKAAKARVTKTFLILKALSDAGFDVPDAGLIPDGRARR